MVEEEQTWCKPWERVDFEKVGVQHVDCVGDDGGDVIHGGDVEESHGLPCNLLNSMRRDEHIGRTATSNFCLDNDADFCFQMKYLHKLDFSYFFSISFGFVSIFLTLKTSYEHT